MNIDQLRTEAAAAAQQAQSTFARISGQAKAENRLMTPSEKAEVEGFIEKASTIKTRLDHARGDANMMFEVNRLTAGMTPGGTGSSSGGRGGAHSIGQQILDSETGKWLQANRGRFPSGTWQSPSSEIMATTLTSDAASGGDLIIADHRPGILPLPTRPLQVADLMAPGTTDSNLVSYLKETSHTNAADTVLEGGTKPESAIVFDAVSDPVRKIAHWIPVTEEMLEDVSALRSYLDTRMRYFVLLVEDDQILQGDGTAPNISGILDRAGITAAHARGADTGADAILKQIGIVELATNMMVDGIVMHPTNWDTLLMSKDTNAAYHTGGGPFAAPTRKTLWGRNVAVTPAIAVGTALVGAFSTAAQFFRRGGLRVEASNSHSDFFIKNLVAIRAEERGALCVYREAAFGLVTGLV